jgi:hypothetical protein
MPESETVRAAKASLSTIATRQAQQGRLNRHRQIATAAMTMEAALAPSRNP